MRVSIMSMQRIANYGSFLQAYALKKTIETLGHSLFIDCYCRNNQTNRNVGGQYRIRSLLFNGW